MAKHSRKLIKNFCVRSHVIKYHQTILVSFLPENCFIIKVSISFCFHVKLNLLKGGGQSFLSNSFNANILRGRKFIRVCLVLQEGNKAFYVFERVRMKLDICSLCIKSAETLRDKKKFSVNGANFSPR